jgi:hypothetical protein
MIEQGRQFGGRRRRAETLLNPWAEDLKIPADLPENANSISFRIGHQSENSMGLGSRTQRLGCLIIWRLFDLHQSFAKWVVIDCAHE